MSYIDFYSKMFEYFGNWSIKLAEALNRIILSYRQDIEKEKKEEAKQLLSELLDELLTKNTGKDSNAILLHEIFNNMLTNTRYLSHLRNIRKRINTDQHLTENEIIIVDKIINKLDDQAAIAYRRMKRGKGKNKNLFFN